MRSEYSFVFSLLSGISILFYNCWVLLILPVMEFLLPTIGVLSGALIMTGAFLISKESKLKLIGSITVVIFSFLGIFSFSGLIAGLIGIIGGILGILGR